MTVEGRDLQMNEQRIRFTDADLRLFSRASHDRNPLHLSEDHARRTPFGEPVVFGVLGVLAGLSAMQQRPGLTVRRIAIEFVQAMFKEIEYRSEVEEISAERTSVRLLDGSRVVLRGTVEFGPWSAQPWQLPPAKAPTPAATDAASVQRGFSLRGEYLPAAADFASLLERFALHQAPVSGPALAALLWCSFVTGMHLPGERGLLARISIDLDLAAIPASGALDYEAEVVAQDRATNQMRTRFTIRSAGRPWARGELRAFHRRPARQIAAAGAGRPGHPRQGSRALAGKVAVIVGGSRGLGAALACRLAAEGSTVIAISRSGENVSADDLVPGGGSIIPIAGDGADPSFSAEAAALVRREHGRLDFLFCNAAPPLRPLWIEPAAADRVGDYVRRSVLLAMVPMAALLPMLDQAGGWLVFSSALAVRQAPAEFPHHVSAKLAVEGLIAAAVAEYTSVSGLVVRSPRLLTDFVSHLSGAPAVAPGEVVTRLLDRLTGPAVPGHCEIIEIA